MSRGSTQNVDLIALRVTAVSQHIGLAASGGQLEKRVQIQEHLW